jgi:hypothetical protein
MLANAVVSLQLCNQRSAETHEVLFILTLVLQHYNHHQQITASMTFLPLLSEPCAFDLLVYANKEVITTTAACFTSCCNASSDTPQHAPYCSTVY